MHKTLALLAAGAWAACLAGCQPAARRDTAPADLVAGPDSMAAPAPAPAAIPATAGGPPPGGTRITCAGIGQIGFGLTETELAARLGEKNVRRDSVFAESEFMGLRTLVFPDTPREVMVDWQEEQPPFRTVRSLGLRHQASVYRFANGIGIGTTAAELVARNGAPIRFGGMGWDYGGGFAGFTQGRLKDEMPCFTAEFDVGSSEPGFEELLGEKEIKSDTLTKNQLGAVSIIALNINRK